MNKLLACIAKNLMLMTRNDNERATGNLCAAISQKIQKEVSNQIQRKSRTTENIPKLSNLLCGYESSLSIIHDKFGEFGVEIWCPAFALSVIKVVLPTLDGMKPKIGSKQSEKQKELIEEFIPIYMKIKNMFQYARGSSCQSTKSKFYRNFQPCISTLLDLIKEKGKHRIILTVNFFKHTVALLSEHFLSIAVTLCTNTSTLSSCGHKKTICLKKHREINLKIK